MGDVDVVVCVFELYLGGLCKSKKNDLCMELYVYCYLFVCGVILKGGWCRVDGRWGWIRIRIIFNLMRISII